MRRTQQKRGPAFRDTLLTKGVEALLSGDVDAGRAILRDNIKSDLAGSQTGTESKSPMRMLGPKGNPTGKNPLSIIGNLQRASGISLHVRTR